MYKLFVALVVLQVCWGEHASHRSRHMQGKADIQRDTVLRERSDAKLVAPKDEYPQMKEEAYGTVEIPKIAKTGNFVPGMQVAGDIEGDIAPEKLILKKVTKGDEEQFDDEMDVKEDGEDTVVITKRSSKLGAFWPGGVVPYEISGNVNSKYISLIDDAIADLKKYTCVVFRKRRRSDKEYAVFEDRGQGTGCNSPIGYPPARWNGNPRYYKPRVNKINLESSACNTHGVVLHEMLHTIGLHHEQVRYDRNKFLTILKKNVKQSMFEANFKKISYADKDKWTNYGTKYDYYSIMQYGAYFFSTEPGKKITIKTNDPKYQWLIGRMEHMSPIDAYQINKMYPCSGKEKPQEFQCIDKRDRCDLILKNNPCSTAYSACCKSCREGVKCKDYKKNCRAAARMGGCNAGNADKKFTDQQCCKTCKDVAKLYRSCFDKYSNCPGMVAKGGGFCMSGNNRLDCCASCKETGSTECKDYPERGSQSCRYYARRGGCNRGDVNKKYMEEKCCKTCKDHGRKYRGCTNKFTNCEDLAKANDYGYCRNSAGVPGDGAVECCASCKERVGTVKCKDNRNPRESPSCRDLARRGACNRGNADKRYMDQSCCKTCKVYGGRYKNCIDRYTNCKRLVRQYSGYRSACCASYKEKRGRR